MQALRADYLTALSIRNPWPVKDPWKQAMRACKQDIADNIKGLCSHSDQSMGEIAAGCGIGVASLYQIQSGIVMPNLQTLYGIADHFDMDVYELLPARALWPEDEEPDVSNG